MSPVRRHSRLLAADDAGRARYLARRIKKPIVLDALKFYRATLPPARFKQLNVDEAYQRVRMTSWVNDLIQAVKSGGSIPDPIAVAERPDGSLWIVDGQQRFWAASECGIPLEATIYKVPDPRTDDYATERRLFYVLNRAKALTSNKKVGAWSGQVTTILRRVEASGAYPHKIGYEWASQSAYGAPVLVRGVVALLSPGPSPAFDDIDSVLRTSETLLAAREAPARAQAFLLIVPRVFKDPKTAKFLSVIALARVVRQAGFAPPTAQACARLSRVNVHALTLGSYAKRFLPMVIAAYERHWPPAAAPAPVGGPARRP